MKTIQNKTRKPLSVPLPHGKRLFLGPGKTGQIATKAAEHPPIVALIEAGELEIVGEGSGFSGNSQNTGGSIPQGPGYNPAKGVFRSGDG